jgi:hypothetical protein
VTVASQDGPNIPVRQEHGGRSSEQGAIHLPPFNRRLVRSSFGETRSYSRWAAVRVGGAAPGTLALAAMPISQHRLVPPAR